MRNKTLREKGDLIFMNSRLAKKISGSVVVLMLLSAMMPVLAFAGLQFKSYSYVNSTVTAEVYGDDELKVTGDVHLKILNTDRDLIKTVTVSSDTYSLENGFRIYDFIGNNVTGSVYGAVYLQAEYTVEGFPSTVTEEVYVEHVTRSSGGSGGGGGGFFGPIGGATINVGSSVSASALHNAFNNNTEVTLKISGSAVSIPASALAEIAAEVPGAKLTIEAAAGTYELPLAAIDFEAIAEELGVELEDLTLVVGIEALAGADAASVEEAAEELGGNLLASPVDFSVSFEANGETADLSDFGDYYVNRTINLDAEVEAPANTTGALYDPETGSLSFIPATFADGVATLKSTTNSIYVVVESDNSFTDVNGHWGQVYVETMANKLIVNGYGNGVFLPDQTITRAEFATLVVRALGLSSKTGTASFSDVEAGSWYEDAVAVAADAGIITGYPDGTFRPNEVINREELAAMVVRASAYADTNLSVTAGERAALLAAFTDANSIVWANTEIASAIDAGIINGFEDDTLRPRDTATRAQAAAMIQRFLVNAEFID